jgi:hypothetical protein
VEDAAHCPARKCEVWCIGSRSRAGGSLVRHGASLAALMLRLATNWQGWLPGLGRQRGRQPPAAPGVQLAVLSSRAGNDPPMEGGPGRAMAPVTMWIVLASSQWTARPAQESIHQGPAAAGSRGLPFPADASSSLAGGLTPLLKAPLSEGSAPSTTRSNLDGPSPATCT